HHEGPHVLAPRFLDELLHDHARLEAVERFDHRDGGLLRVGQHHAEALRALEQLDDAGRTTHAVHHAGHVLAVVGEHRLGHAHPATAEDLQAAELVTAAHQRLAFGGGEHLHHLELAHHRGAEEGDAGTDARDDGVDAFERLAVIDHVRVAL